MIKGSKKNRRKGSKKYRRKGKKNSHSHKKVSHKHNGNKKHIHDINNSTIKNISIKGNENNILTGGMDTPKPEIPQPQSLDPRNTAKDSSNIFNVSIDGNQNNIANRYQNNQLEKQPQGKGGPIDIGKDTEGEEEMEKYEEKNEDEDPSPFEILTNNKFTMVGFSRELINHIEPDVALEFEYFYDNIFIDEFVNFFAPNDDYSDLNSTSIVASTPNSTPIGDAKTATSNINTPIGDAKTATSNAYTPIGNAYTPIGNAYTTTGNAKTATGNAYTTTDNAYTLGSKTPYLEDESVISDLTSSDAYIDNISSTVSNESLIDYFPVQKSKRPNTNNYLEERISKRPNTNNYLEQRGGIPNQIKDETKYKDKNAHSYELRNCQLDTYHDFKFNANGRQNMFSEDDIRKLLNNLISSDDSKCKTSKEYIQKTSFERMLIGDMIKYPSKFDENFQDRNMKIGIIQEENFNFLFTKEHKDVELIEPIGNVLNSNDTSSLMDIYVSKNLSQIDYLFLEAAHNSYYKKISTVMNCSFITTVSSVIDSKKTSDIFTDIYLEHILLTKSPLHLEFNPVLGLQKINTDEDYQNIEEIQEKNGFYNAGIYDIIYKETGYSFYDDIYKVFYENAKIKTKYRSLIYTDGEVEIIKGVMIFYYESDHLYTHVLQQGGLSVESLTYGLNIIQEKDLNTYSGDRGQFYEVNTIFRKLEIALNEKRLEYPEIANEISLTLLNHKLVGDGGQIRCVKLLNELLTSKIALVTGDQTAGFGCIIEDVPVLLNAFKGGKDKPIEITKKQTIFKKTANFLKKKLTIKTTHNDTNNIDDDNEDDNEDKHHFIVFYLPSKFNDIQLLVKSKMIKIENKLKELTELTESTEYFEKLELELKTLKSEYEFKLFNKKLLEFSRNLEMVEFNLKFGPIIQIKENEVQMSFFELGKRGRQYNKLITQVTQDIIKGDDSPDTFHKCSQKIKNIFNKKELPNIENIQLIFNAVIEKIKNEIPKDNENISNIAIVLQYLKTNAHNLLFKRALNEQQTLEKEDKKESIEKNKKNEKSKQIEEIEKLKNQIKEQLTNIEYKLVQAKNEIKQKSKIAKLSIKSKIAEYKEQIKILNKNTKKLSTNKGYNFFEMIKQDFMKNYTTKGGKHKKSRKIRKRRTKLKNKNKKTKRKISNRSKRTKKKNNKVSKKYKTTRKKKLYKD